MPKPDIVFYINVSENDIAKRSGFGEEKYEKLDFPAMKEAWPLIATYIKEHRNFYNQLEAIVCSELSEIALPQKLRRNYYPELTQNTFPFNPVMSCKIV